MNHLKKNNAMKTRFDLDKIHMSYFPSMKATTPIKSVSLNKILGQHATNDDLVDAIRRETNPDKRAKLKTKAAGYTPSGIFSKRNDSSLIKHSGLICLDFDKLGDSIDDVKDYIGSLPYVLYCGLSCSGNGLWVLIPISDTAKHAEHYLSLENDFMNIGLKIDPTGKNLSRFRFWSYDDDGRFNLNAEIYDRVLIPEKPQQKSVSQYPPNLNDMHLDKLVKRIIHAPEGEKHNTLLRVAYVAGGYISTNTFSEGVVVQALRGAIESRKNTVTDMNQAYRTIDYGIRTGKAKGITK